MKNPKPPMTIRKDNDAVGAVEQERIIASFVGEVKLEEDMRDYERRQHLLWSWLQIESHYGLHFDERETAIELKLPWSKRWDFGRRRSRRSYVIVFVRVHTRLVEGAWHVRGGLSYWPDPVLI